jgi:Flp pilus assembly protein TadD
MDSVYDLYTRGCDLLAHGDHMAAIVPLSRARDLEPTKTSIREALGRALFHARRYERAAEEFGAVAAAAPTNDYALFCLGRSMQLLGRHREAAIRSHWPARCARRAPTTACTAIARAAPQRAPPRDPSASRCYSRGTAFVSSQGDGW